MWFSGERGGAGLMVGLDLREFIQPSVILFSSSSCLLKITWYWFWEGQAETSRDIPV